MKNKNSLGIGRFGLITTFSFCALLSSSTALAAIVKTAPVVHCAKNSYTCFLKALGKKQSVTMSMTKTVASVQVTETLSFAPSANGAFAFTTLITQERYVGKVPTKLTKTQIATNAARQKTMTAMKGYRETFLLTDLTKLASVLKNWQKGKFNASVVVDATGKQTRVGDVYDFSSVSDSPHPLTVLDTSAFSRSIVTTSSIVARAKSVDVVAACPAGKIALAGGYTTDWDPSVNFPDSGTANPQIWFKISDLEGDALGPRIETNEPTSDGKGWHVTFFNNTGDLGPLNVTVQAVCGDPSIPSLTRARGAGIPMTTNVAANSACMTGSLPLAGSFSTMEGVPVSFHPDHLNWQIYGINRDTTIGTANPGSICAAATPVESVASAKAGSLLWQVVTSPEVSVATQTVGTASVSCPAGTSAIGGGYTFFQNSATSKDTLLKEGVIVTSAPTANGWSASMYNNWIPFSGAVDGSLRAYTVCLSKASATARFEVFPPLPVSLNLSPSTGSISGTPATPTERTGFIVTFPHTSISSTTTSTLTTPAPTAGISSPSSTSITTHSLKSLNVTSLTPTALSTSQRAVLDATASYYDGKTADVTLLCKWTTSDPSLAIVTDQKILQTLSGTGSVSATCTYTEAGVTVTGSVQFSVQLDPSLQPMSGHPSQ